MMNQFALHVLLLYMISGSIFLPIFEHGYNKQIKHIQVSKSKWLHEFG